MGTLKVVCPYCDDDSKTFASNQKTRLHVFKFHNVLLPSNRDRGKPVNKEKVNGELYSCPCCVITPSYSVWNLKGIDISERFREYFSFCLTNFNNLLDVDQYFNQLLCISSVLVLVLQKRAKYESISKKYFPPSLLEVMRQNVISSLKLPHVLDAKIYMSIKTIIKEYHENNISNLEARHSLIGLAMKMSGAERATILAVESLFPSLKDLDVGSLVESELAASYIHPLIQALLSYDEDDKVARCSNIIPDNGTDVNRRPDYEVTVFEQYQPSYRTCYGELKGEEFSDTSSIVDFYRLGVFAKLEIVASNLTGVLCFQALGSSVTFYTMVHPSSSIFTFVELVTINIPKTKNEIMSLMGFLDELHKIAVYHRTIVRSLAPNAEHPTLPFEFVQGAKKNTTSKEKAFIGINLIQIMSLFDLHFVPLF